MRKAFFVFLTVMCVLSLGIGTAFAAWTAGGGVQTVLTTADSTQLKPVKTLANLVYTTVAGEILAANDLITITLTGGAKFTTAVPTLAPSATVDLGAGVATAAVPISGGGEGSTSATWRVVVGGGAVGVTYTLNTFTVAELDVTGVVIGGNVDAVMTMATSTGIEILTPRSYFTDITNYLFTGAASETVTLTTASDTADVSATTGAFTQFTGGVVVGTATVLSLRNDSGATTLPTTVNISAGKILASLVGDFTGVTSVSATGATGSDSAGSTTGGTANFFLINTGMTAAYAVNTAALAGGATLALAPTFTIDGTTSQAARSFTGKLQILVDGATWTAHVAKDTTTLYTIARNGVSRYVYNLPGSANSDQVFVRVINTSTQAGKVYGTLYDQDGTMIGTASTVLSSSLAANATVIFSAADLETLFGDTWTGRARMSIDAELPSMEAMCLIRSANGTITNLSPVAP